MNHFNVTFEACGFTRCKQLVGATLSAADALAFSQNTLPDSVVAVKGAYITDDDGQDDKDIHVFASVTLTVRTHNYAAAEKLSPPENFLNQIAESLGKDADGTLVLDLDEHSWETTDVEAVS